MTIRTQGNDAESIRQLFDNREDDTAYLKRFVSRFWDKVDTSGDCWEWTASTKGTGYGDLTFYDADGTQKSLKAHRVSKFIHRNGIELSDYQINHTCNNKSCVNPDHLEVGDASGNMADRVEVEKSNYKISDEEVETIKMMYANTEMTQAEIGEQFGISGGYVGGIVRGENR